MGTSRVVSGVETVALGMSFEENFLKHYHVYSFKVDG